MGLDARRIRFRARYWALRARSRIRATSWTTLSTIPSRTTRTDLLPPQLRADDDEGRAQETVGATFQPLRSVVNEYAFVLKGRSYIEPKTGWVIASPCHLVRDSFPYSDWSDFAGNLLSKPSVVRTALLAARSRSHYPSVISLRTAWDDNYFHFFNDVLGRLRMLNELDIPSDVPVVVSGVLANRPYFSGLAAAGVFGGRPVICQPSDVVISADEIFILKRRAGDPRDYEYFLDRLPTAPAREGRGRRLFLTRSAVRGRTMINAEEVEELCLRYEYEPVDTDGMTLAEQVKLFGSASHVVGVHSAGLVNIMFARGRTLSVVEILPPGPLPIGWNAIDEPKTDFEFLCDAFGFTYHSVSGRAVETYYDRSLNFVIDTRDLERALQASLADGAADGPAQAPTSGRHHV